MAEETDPEIVAYAAKRIEVMENERRSRADASFRRDISILPMAEKARKIVSRVRSDELQSIWTPALEDNLAERNTNLVHGAATSLDLERARATRLWQIIKKFPKGALLHAHLAAMVDIEWLVETGLNTVGMCVSASRSMATAKAREAGILIFQYSASTTEEYRRRQSDKTIWAADYVANELIPINQAANTFPDGGIPGFSAWMERKCTITYGREDNSRLSPHALSQKFGRCFATIDSLLFYEPIFRLAIQRIFEALIRDRIMYAEFRVVFVTKFYRLGQETADSNYLGFVEVFSEEVKKRLKPISGDDLFGGARIIWTIRRKSTQDEITSGMKSCILVKKAFPEMIAGFDFAGQEVAGRSLKSLVPALIWFKEECSRENLKIPFFFHAGECLGDGDETDDNLFDALLLGTRRIGHALSLIKHPILMDMLKRNKVLVESCLTSNLVLRLIGSVQSHPLPAMLAHGIPVALGNDDPSIFGDREIGLTNEFYQVLHLFENVGLDGLAHLAENSIRWSCFEDQVLQVWQDDIAGKDPESLKARMLRLWKNQFAAYCVWIAETFEDVDC